MQLVLLLLTLLLLSVPSYGQTMPSSDPFCRLTKESGLAGESVTHIITDHAGRVWMATSNGVNCYNGRDLETFTLPSASSSRAYAYDICEGDDHNIYVATDVGVYCLRSGSNAFERIMPEVDRAEAILAARGILYAGNGEGLWVAEDGNISTVKVGDAPISLDNSVRDIQQAEDGTIWFLTRYALNSYNPSTRKHTSRVLSPLVPDGAAFSRLALLGERFLIASKNNGLFLYDPADKVHPMTPVEGVGNVINSLVVTESGEVCVGTDGAGAVLLDGKTLTPVERFSTQAADAAHRLPTEGAYFYRRDANHVDWFGFYRLGAMHSWHSCGLFRQYSAGAFSAQGMEVRSFLLEPTLKVLGTNHGMFFIDEANGTVRNIPQTMLDGMHIITSIVRFGKFIYAASYDGGVRRIDSATLQVMRLSEDEKLASGTVCNLVVSPQDELWMLTADGVYVLDRAGNLRHYTEHNSKLKGGAARDVRFDSHGNGWVVTGKGLSIYVASARQFEDANFPDGFLADIPNLALSHSPSDTLFFYHGTRFYYTDERMKDFGTLSLPLKGESCYGFLDDGTSYWVATEDGLMRVSHDSLSLRHYGYAEGLQSKIVTNMVLWNRNQLWVGTYNGLFVANTDSLLREDRHAPCRVVVHDILRGGERLTWSEQQQVNLSHSLRVAWNFKSQQVSLLAILPDFAQPIGRKYEWRLEGEPTWQELDEGTPLRLPSLLPGNHRLEIRLAGVASTLSVIRLEVRPSAMAYMEFAAVVFFILILLFIKRMDGEKKLLRSERDDMEAALMEMESTKEKYEKVRINEEECAMILEKIKAYLETEKAYTNPDLKMKDLADRLHLSASKLSQVLNLYLGESYYEFINRYRLEEFKRLIDQGEQKRFTITALSEQCGFKKSNFFSTFRRMEGMTPAEYLKQHGAN